MGKIVYLDNNATTQVDKEVLDAMMPYLEGDYGNPSSQYLLGRRAREAVNQARQSVAELLSVNSENIFFTSSGSESNTAAIMGIVKSFSDKRHIITTQVEHTSILETMKHLEAEGHSVTYLGVDKLGRLSLDELRSAITNKTCLISIMMANNEIGNIYPIKELAKIAHDRNILFHTDAVQAIGKFKFGIKDIDLLSISGHKLNAPKGVGALYIRDRANFTPLIFGHQEKGLRGGTENVPAIVGLGRAAEIIMKDNFTHEKRIKELRDYLENEVKKKIDEVLIYGDLTHRIPNTSSMAFRGVGADELMILLESFDCFVSTGSACNTNSASPSHVLTACHADLANYGPIRVSLGIHNTKEEVDRFINVLSNTVNTIRRRTKWQY